MVRYLHHPKTLKKSGMVFNKRKGSKLQLTEVQIRGLLKGMLASIVTAPAMRVSLPR